MSKEEIEKAKEWLNWMQKQDLFLPYTSNILQYIDQLEVSNKELDKENNRLEKIEFERDKANKIIDLMTEQLAGLTIWNNEKEEALILMNKEEVKQYYEEKLRSNKR